MKLLGIKVSEVSTYPISEHQMCADVKMDEENIEHLLDQIDVDYLADYVRKNWQTIIDNTEE